MPTVEEQLTDLLARRADGVPVDMPLLAGVRQRARRAAGRRRAAIAVAVAAVVAVAVVPAAILGGPHQRRPPVTGAPAPVDSEFFVPAPSLTPTFPMTPSYLPPGVKRTPLLTHQPGSSFASYESAREGRDGPLTGIDVAVHSARPPAQPGVGAIRVTVQGHPASLLLQPQTKQASVTWLARPGSWVQVTGSNAWSTRSDVLAVADGLREGTVTGRPYFTIVRAPAGLALVEFHPEVLTLARPEHGPEAVESIMVAARRASFLTDDHGRPVRVGNRSGWLLEQGGRYVLMLKLSPTVRLNVSTPAGGSWTEARLRQFASGVSYHGPTPRAEG